MSNNGSISRLDSLLAELRDRGWQPGAVAGWTDPDDLHRNYERIARCRMSRENLLLACVTIELLALNQPDTVRGVMYSVVSAGWLPDTSSRSYGRIQRLLQRLRENDRIVPFHWIVDNVRQTIKPPSWHDLDDFSETVRGAYRKDLWSSLPECVEIVVEKDTVAGRVAPVTVEYGVALHPLRGYTSSSFAHAIAQHWDAIDKPIHCYYIGDHDPSGRDLERDFRAKIERYSGREFHWKRLAVRPEDFEAFDIIPLKVKHTDTRARQFVDQFGTKCAEVEAIPAVELRRRVGDAITTHIPEEQWAHLQAVEEAERETWTDALDSLSTT